MIARFVRFLTLGLGATLLVALFGPVLEPGHGARALRHTLPWPIPHPPENRSLSIFAKLPTHRTGRTFDDFSYWHQSSTAACMMLGQSFAAGWPFRCYIVERRSPRGPLPYRGASQIVGQTNPSTPKPISSAQPAASSQPASLSVVPLPTGIALNTMVFSGCLIVLSRAGRFVKGRFGPRTCLACGYRLVGTQHGCPECGLGRTG